MATRKERRLTGNGSRLVAIGVPLVVVGIVLAILIDGVSRGIGVAIALLGALPVAAGIALMLSAGVEQHSRKGRPFA